MHQDEMLTESVPFLPKSMGQGPDEFICNLCAEHFTFEPGEKRFFAAHGLSPPHKCKACRAAVRGSKGDRSKALTRIHEKCKSRRKHEPNAQQLRSRDEHGGNQKLPKNKTK